MTTILEQLLAVLDSHDSQLTDARTERDIATAALADEQRKHGITQDNLDAAQQVIGELATEIDALKARIAALEPAPARRRPLLGGSSPGPETGMSNAAVQRVIDRWGKGVAVRSFSPSGWTPAPNVADCGRLLASWKPDLTRPIDEQACLAALASAPAGSKVCVWHEPDVKIRQGGADARGMRDRQREFARIVRTHRPDLDIMGVLSAYTFHPQRGFKVADYLDLADFDVLAVDLDGSTGYLDYAGGRVPQLLDWLASVGRTRWTVAEYGTETTTGFGPAERAAWLEEQTRALLALDNPPEEICLFEAKSMPAYILSDGVERDTWAKLVAETRQEG